MFRGKVSDYSFFIILPLFTSLMILLDSFSGTIKFTFYSLFSVFLIVFFFVTFFYISDFNYRILLYIFGITLFFFSVVAEPYKMNTVQYLAVTCIYSVFFINTFSLEKIFSYRFNVHGFQGYLFMIYLISLAISIFLVNYKDVFSVEGISKTSLMLISLFVSGYYFPKVLIKREDLLLLLIKLIFYVGFLAALFGVITFLSFVTFKPEYDNTTISFFMSPNNTPFMYTFSIPCGLYLFFSKQHKLSIIERYSIIPIIFLMVFNVLFTFSRAGILSMVVAIMIFMFFHSKVIFAFSFASMAAIAGVLFRNFIAPKGAISAFSRVSLMAACIKMLSGSRTGLLFGFGVVTAQKEFKIVMENEGIFEEFINFPHNFFLFYIMQFGLISFIFLSIFMSIVLFKSLINAFKYKKNRYGEYLILGLTIVLSLFVQSMLEDMILFPQYFVFHLSLIFVGLLIQINGKIKLQQQAS